MNGIVAILNADGNAVVEVRDLGPEPIRVRPERVLPLVEIKPKLEPRQIHGSYADDIQKDRVVRTWTVEAETWRVSTYTVVRRLEAAGLIDAAEAALESNRVLFRRFYTVGSIPNDDADARRFLTAVGANPDDILRPE
jgi:hypothetical protein